MLVDDRTEVLTNEAFLIADQTVAGYVQGVYTKDELQESLRYYSDKLNASIWVTDEKASSMDLRMQTDIQITPKYIPR